MSLVHERLALEEVAALVGSTLEAHGVHVVLSGSAVVSIYAEKPLASCDLGFDLEGIEVWSRRERASDGLREFARRLDELARRS